MILANPNPRLENLRPFTSNDPRAKKIQAKGGVASGVTKRRKRTMKEDAEWLLNLAIGGSCPTDVDGIVEYAQIEGKTITTGQALLTRALTIALESKNPKDALEAMKFLRDTSGQKPADSIALSGTVNNPMQELTTEELRALAYDEKPKKKRGRPKKVKDE